MGSMQHVMGKGYPGKSRLKRRMLASALPLVLGALAGCIKQKGVSWRAPAFAPSWNLRVGSGAEYRATCHWGSPTVVEIAVVGEEQIAGRKAYQLEISTRQTGSPAEVVLKSLFYRNQRQVVFLRGVLRLPGRPAAELPDSWLFTWTRGELALVSGYIDPYKAPVYLCQDGVSTCSENLTILPADLPPSRSVGKEVLGTPAGPFTSQLWRFRDSSTEWRPEGRPINVWIASDAGPFGVVEARLRDPYNYNADLTLTRVFTDVRDRIAGTPLRVQRNELRDWVLQPKDPLLHVCFPQVGLPAPPHWAAP